MLENNNTAKILGMEEVIVKKVEENENGLKIYIELPRKEHKCPCCGETTNHVHDYREQKIKDIPLGRPTVLHLRKRRYVCQKCGKRFYEKNSFLTRYYHITNRAIHSIIDDLRKTVSVFEVAKRYNVSSTTATRYFDKVKYTCRSLPYVLSVDEFKGNSGGEKYNAIIVDPKNKKVLDILPDRYENHLITYLSSFSNRDNVKYFITDMNPHFKRAAEISLPKATIVADKYHVIRQVNWALERVRKKEQEKLSDKFRKYFKHSRSLMFKPYKDLSDDEKDRLALMFEIAPRLGRAYYLKNKFLGVMHSKNSKEGRKKLANWLILAEYENMDEFKNCITAYRNWYSEILNSLDVPWTNGYIEGCNNKTKVLKRVCFGMQNFERFRNRILHMRTQKN